MISRGYASTREPPEIFDVPNRLNSMRVRRMETDFQHLVEIAIIKTPVPADVYEGPAHERWNRIGIEVIDEQAHVRLLLSGSAKRIGEPLDGHIRDRE